MFGLFLSALIWLFQAKVQDIAAPIAFGHAAAFLGWFYVVCAVVTFVGLLALTTGALGTIILSVLDRFAFLRGFRSYLAVIGTLGTAYLVYQWVANAFRYIALICGAFTLSFAVRDGEWHTPTLWIGGILLFIGLLIASSLKNRRANRSSH